MSKQQQSVDFHHWCFCVFDSFFGLCFFFHMVLRTQPNPFNLAERPLNQRRRKKKKTLAVPPRRDDSTQRPALTRHSARFRVAFIVSERPFSKIFSSSSTSFFFPPSYSGRYFLGLSVAVMEPSVLGSSDRIALGEKKNQFNSIGQSSDRVRVTSKCLELVFWDLG